MDTQRAIPPLCPIPSLLGSKFISHNHIRPPLLQVLSHTNPITSFTVLKIKSNY